MRALLIAALLLAGCPKNEMVRVGADQTLQELGLVEFVLAAFEHEHKVKTRLRHGRTDELSKWALEGSLDFVFVVSEASLQLLQKESIPSRGGTYAHEEFVVIGPFEDKLGRHNDSDATDLLASIARTNHRFYKGRRGSAEWARQQLLFKRTNDRAEPGSFFNADVWGVELVKKAIDDQSFALVKRSSLLQAVLQGRLPHRIYREADPDLVLRMVLVEVHPAKAKSAPHPELFEFVMGEKGHKLVETFGADRFGYPAFGVGEPEEGKGARVPKLGDKKGLAREQEEEEEEKEDVKEAGGAK